MTKCTRILFPLLFISLTLLGQHQDPIIDVHLHAYPLWIEGDTSWYPKKFRRPASSEELMRQTIQEMTRYNIVKAVGSGRTPEIIQKWKNFAKNLLIPGYELFQPPKGDEIEKLRQQIKSGEIKVFAEVCTQYMGINPSDTVMEPLYKLAEEYDIPIGIHTGLGPPGIAYTTGYRSYLSSPLLLEEALIRHPKMRLYVMHAGWPMLDDMVAMLYAFPNLYVDIAVINWYIPKPEFYTYLKRLVDAGFSKRIMYGSDQMQWPETIGASIKSIEEAPFLTKEQKRDIFYNNAVRFFKLNESK